MQFSVTQIIGKTLYGIHEAIKVHHLPVEASNVIRTVPKGAPVGVVFSYVLREGVVWWQLENSGWVKHEKGKFSISHLLDQGAIDEATLNAPTTKERLTILFDNILKTANWLVPILSILFVVYFLTKAYKTAKA